MIKFKSVFKFISCIFFLIKFGFILNGVDDDLDDEVDEYGTRWTTVVRDYNTNW